MKPLSTLKLAQLGVFWLLVLSLVLPASAAAHAELLGTAPANETTMTEHPTEVVLTFSEQITVAFGGVTAYGPDGERVNAGDPKASDDTITLPITSTEPGTYAVAWRAISADGHPIRGAFVFHVEESSADSVSRDQALNASEGSRAKDIGFGVARGIMLLAVLVAAGMVIFAVVAARGGGVWRLRTWLGVALVAMAATYVLDASVASGLSLLDTLDPGVLKEQASTIYGRATLIRIALALLCLILVWRVATRGMPTSNGRRIALLVPFIALTAALSLSGHAVGEGMPVLRLPLDMLHGLAGAAWIGGLVQLLRMVRSEAHVDPAVVRRYSKLALTSVIVLVATGLYAAWVEIGVSLDGVLDTTYGRLVLIKAVLLVATLPLANANRVRNVPKLDDPTGAAEARTRLRSYVRGELVLLAIVIAATAWLIQSVPAKVDLRPGFVEQETSIAGGGSVQLIVDPAEAGRNELHLYIFNAMQQPDTDVTEVEFSATNEEREIGPLDVELESIGPGHFTAPVATLPFAGEWDIATSIRRGEFDEDIARFTVRIAP